MDNSEKLLLIMQIATNFLLLLTVGVYFLQWRTMQKQLQAASEQLRIAQNSANAQNLFALISYLQEPEARDSRAWVLQRLEGSAFSDWKTEDRDCASRVC